MSGGGGERGGRPGDGSNGPDVLSESGVVRKDIRSSFGSSSGVADGVPYTISFTVVDIGNGCNPLTGAAVYVWHCDREGRYSMYSQGATDQNYLRGVQPVDASGVATFTSIFPACYAGRWTHVHFEVYPSVDAATRGPHPLAPSQLVARGRL
jgi:protocatechuate 3,4-dioxygenase beta subunit